MGRCRRVLGPFFDIPPSVSRHGPTGGLAAGERDSSDPIVGNQFRDFGRSDEQRLKNALGESGPQEHFFDRESALRNS